IHRAFKTAGRMMKAKTRMAEIPFRVREQVLRLKALEVFGVGVGLRTTLVAEGAGEPVITVIGGAVATVVGRLVKVTLGEGEIMEMVMVGSGVRGETETEAIFFCRFFFE